MMATAKRTRTKTTKTAVVIAPEEPPLIRIAISADDLRRLLDIVPESSDDPVVHRLRMRLAKHRMRWSK